MCIKLKLKILNQKQSSPLQDKQTRNSLKPPQAACLLVDPSVFLDATSCAQDRTRMGSHATQTGPRAWRVDIVPLPWAPEAALLPSPEADTSGGTASGRHSTDVTEDSPRGMYSGLQSQWHESCAGALRPVIVPPKDQKSSKTQSFQESVTPPDPHPHSQTRQRKPSRTETKERPVILRETAPQQDGLEPRQTRAHTGHLPR